MIPPPAVCVTPTEAARSSASKPAGANVPTILVFCNVNGIKTCPSFRHPPCALLRAAPRGGRHPARNRAINRHRQSTHSNCSFIQFLFLNSTLILYCSLPCVLWATRCSDPLGDEFDTSADVCVQDEALRRHLMNHRHHWRKTFQVGRTNLAHSSGSRSSNSPPNRWREWAESTRRMVLLTRPGLCPSQPTRLSRA